MNKKTIYVILVFFLLTVTFGFSNWINKDQFSFKENDVITEEKLFKTEQKTQSTFACASPSDQGVKNLKSDEATIYWDDDSGTAWEYIIQLPTAPYPTGSGTPTTVKEVTITQDSNGNNLQPDTTYEFYVRTDCGTDGQSSWLGPFDFKTLCLSFVVPFTEGFNTTSTTFDCWTIIDNNKDAVSLTGNNIWKQHTAYTYEGDRAMYFKGDSGKTHDDWLISPGITMTGGIYAISYYYKTSSTSVADENEFEVLLSQNGIDVDHFTTILLPKQTYSNSNFKKKIIYIQGITADVNIAWRVASSKQTEIYLDILSVEEVDCVGLDLDDIEITDLKIDEVTFEWTDPTNGSNNAQWEYYLQPVNGGMPAGSGTLTNNKEETITRVNGGGTLQPNTEYEFWIRFTCGLGKNSNWVGPVVFRTPCAALSLPFWEGFNSDSTTRDCWIYEVGAEEWYLGGANFPPYEGDGEMQIVLGNPIGNITDKWLVSPTFLLDETKVYRLKFHNNKRGGPVEFEILASNKGPFKEGFTHTLLPKSILYDPEGGSESKMLTKVFFTGIGGEVSLAWHVTKKGYLTVDNVFLEEVDCPEPVNLGSKDEEEDKATIYWEDNFGSDWEYIVQKLGGTTPSSTTKGAATKNTELVIDEDINGDNLAPSTEYALYVRTRCGGGKYSEWSGPHVFKTACGGVFSTPFWEGFNTDSDTSDCWTIVDANGNSSVSGSSYVDTWAIGRSSYYYEGNQSARFYGSLAAALPHDDWLISPKIRFESGKTYRLKFHHSTQVSLTSADYEFEVLLSNSGVDTSKFATSVVPKKKYDPSTVWREEYVLISGVSGDVNIAWHVSSSTSRTDIYIDNVFIEEVTGCSEPLPSTLGTKDENTNEVTVFWEDDTGATAWEYYIQEKGGSMPTGSGIATKDKENVTTLDGLGNILKPNTDYEFYVRTDCSNGEYSVWSGPYEFTTLCGSYGTPFFENFNSKSKSLDCWTVVDANNDGDIAFGANLWTTNGMFLLKYEGDGGMLMNNMMNMDENDDWLISPEVNLNGGQYILKYHYFCMPDFVGIYTFNNEFEVLLSDSGSGIANFTNTIVPYRNYTNAEWQEEVAFIENVKGDVNIAWHVAGEGFNLIGLDNISLKEVVTCPEPYYVRITAQTVSSADIEWEQYDDSVEWEVMVVSYGEDNTASPIQTIKVTGNPKATISGLGSSGYTVYVRAKCENDTGYSDWSTPIDIVGEVSNDECSGAINIPVNNGNDCDLKVEGITRGASLSKDDLDPNPCGGGMYDIWFEFTATSSKHLLSIEEFIDMDKAESIVPTVSIFVYDQDCSTIGSGGGVPIDCVFFTQEKEERVHLLEDLQSGQKYYIRLFSNNETLVSLCIREANYLKTDYVDSEYSAEDLVREVLLKLDLDCDIVSNVKFQVGDGKGTVNSVGYFERNGSNFPFERGIVLATHDIGSTEGPYDNTMVGASSSRHRKVNQWTGDAEINDFIDVYFDPLHSSSGGSKFMSTLEFDFIAVKDSLEFEFLFASDFYNGRDVNNAACIDGQAFFLAFLTDLVTEEKQNIALVTNTNDPIATSTIRDSELSGAPCESVNPEFFWKYYDIGPFTMNYLAPVNYRGLTIPIKTQSAPLVLGRKYKMKLAVVNFNDSSHYGYGASSAVFLNAGSLDLEMPLDIGEDLLIATNTALCPGESGVIQSGIATSDELYMEIEWYKDGVLISGANTPDLEVSEAGEYKVVMKLTELNCEFTDTLVVEVYPPISEVVHQAEAIEVCQYSLQETIVDLTVVETAMFAAVDRSIYTTGYYLTETDAETTENTISEAANYSIGKEPQAQTIYIRVENTETGCYEVFELHIQPEEGSVPDKPSDVTVCAEYVFPEIAGNQYYYTEPGGAGKAYKTGDILAEPGEHTLYLLQVNSGEGCYEETAYQINITAPVTADVFEDKTLSCEYYQLAPLSEHNRYYTEPEGQGTELYEGMQILHKQIVYVYASSEDGLCTDESNFTIDYEDCPIPRGISPNNDGLNDVFDLTPHGVESLKIYNRWGTEVYIHGEGYTTQWHGQSKSGKQLPDGTYYYVIHAHGKIRTGWVQINK